MNRADELIKLFDGNNILLIDADAKMEVAQC